MKEATLNVTPKEPYISRHKSTTSECRPEWKAALTINTEANDVDICKTREIGKMAKIVISVTKF